MITNVSLDKVTTFNDLGCRFYQIPTDTTNYVYPSITSMLGNTQSEEKRAMLNRWRDRMGHAKADAFTEEAARRGTAVHWMLEQYFDGKKLDDIDYSTSTADDIIMFKSMIKFNAKNVTKVYRQETPLFSHALQIAGRVDLIGEWKNVPAVVDFKTSGRLKGDDDVEDYWLQITFYAIAHNEMFGTDIDRGVILMGTKNSLPQVWCQDDLLNRYGEKLLNRIDHFYEVLHNATVT